MRTLFEILESAKDGHMPTHEECYWAMLALDAISTTQGLKLMKLMAEDPPSETQRRLIGSDQFTMMKSALNADPQVWLGPNHDPANPECQRFRKMALGLMERVLEKAKDKR